MKPDAVSKEVESYLGIKGEEIRRREQRYTEAWYVVSFLLRRRWFMSLWEIGEKVGLHYSVVGNAIRSGPGPLDSVPGKIVDSVGREN